jgi:hypothetical protein
LSESEVVRLDGFERLFAQTNPIELEHVQSKQVEVLRPFFYNIDRLHRNATLYHFEHTSVKGLKTRLAENIQQIFEVMTEFTVEVQPFELVLFGHQVFEHQNVDNHYLFRMFQDGVRKLTIRRGLTEAELMRFCRLFVLDLSRPDLFEDDVVTLIWSEDFQHITIESNDLLSTQATSSSEDQHSVSALLNDLNRLRSEAKLGDRRTRFAQLDLRMLSLGRTDLALFGFNELYLGTEARDKFGRLMQSNVRERFEKFVEILFQIHLQFSNSTTGRSERIAVLFDRIADAMLDGQDFGELERLVNKLKTMMGSEESQASVHKVSVDYILEHWGQEEFVKRILSPVLNSDKDLIASSIGIISQLSDSAVPAICHFCCQIADPRIRAKLWSIIAKNISGHQVNIARSVVSASIPVAREILQLLSENSNSQDLGKLLLNGLRNPEAAVRLETMSIVERCVPEQASNLLIRALSDLDSAVRGKALHLLARQRSSLALKTVWSIITDAQFSGFSLDEKRRFCVTYALCGGDLTEWRKALNARTLIESNDALELKHCALIAMGVQMDPQIASLIERFLGKKKQSLLTEAAGWVEQHINCPREERTRQLYAIFYSGKLVESRQGDVL